MDQRQEIGRPGVLMKEASDVLNDNTIQPDAEIVPLETETERAYRKQFLNELRKQTRHTRRTRTHRLAQRAVVFEEQIPNHDCKHNGREMWRL